MPPCGGCWPRASVPPAPHTASKPARARKRGRMSACSWSSVLKKKRRPRGRRLSVDRSRGRLLLAVGGRGRVHGLRRARGDFGLELLVVVVGDVDPRVAHLVDGAI